MLMVWPLRLVFSAGQLTAASPGFSLAAPCDGGAALEAPAEDAEDAGEEAATGPAEVAAAGDAADDTAAADVADDEVLVALGELLFELHPVRARDSRAPVTRAPLS